MANYIHENITYDELRLIDPSQMMLVSKTLPTSAEHIIQKTDAEIKNEHVYESKTSQRNIAGSYIIDIDKDDVLLNVIPTKRFITDSSISYIINNRFSFFEEPLLSNELPEPFVLSDGTIFRVTGEGVKTRDAYTYYTIENGSVKTLPNYKTVEVMLFERGRTPDEIRVIEPSEFEDLVALTLKNRYIAQGLSSAEADEAVARFILNSEGN